MRQAMRSRSSLADGTPPVAWLAPACSVHPNLLQSGRVRRRCPSRTILQKGASIRSATQRFEQEAVMIHGLEAPRGRCAAAVLSVVLGLAVCEITFAGQAQEAMIIGRVTDESGAVLPGVTVTATSPALQVQHLTDVTNETGEYRLIPLPIGTYTVDYSLAGFQTLRRDGVRLTAGFTARIDEVMKVGALAETITVSGASPVIDVRSTSGRTQLTRESLDVIPTARAGLESAMVQAPGVRTNIDLGSMNVNPEFRAFGRSNDSWTRIEGLPVTSSKSALNATGNRFDYAALEETIVQTLGNTAESPTQGIQINAIVKSGSNDLHGSGFWAGGTRSMQGDNID